MTAAQYDAARAPLLAAKKKADQDAHDAYRDTKEEIETTYLAQTHAGVPGATLVKQKRRDESAAGGVLRAAYEANSLIYHTQLSALGDPPTFGPDPGATRI